MMMMDYDLYYSYTQPKYSSCFRNICSIIHTVHITYTYIINLNVHNQHIFNWGYKAQAVIFFSPASYPGTWTALTLLHKRINAYKNKMMTSLGKIVQGISNSLSL